MRGKFTLGNFSPFLCTMINVSFKIFSFPLYCFLYKKKTEKIDKFLYSKNYLLYTSSEKKIFLKWCQFRYNTLESEPTRSITTTFHIGNRIFRVIKYERMMIWAKFNLLLKASFISQKKVLSLLFHNLSRKIYLNWWKKKIIFTLCLFNHWEMIETLMRNLKTRRFKSAL